MILTDHKKLLYLLLAILVWDIIWRGFALWRAAKQNHKVWYIFLLIFETAGLLPIIFLLWFPKEEKE